MILKSLLLFHVLLSLSRYSSTQFHFANAALVNQTIDDSDVVFGYSPLANWQWSNNSSCTCLQPNLQDAFQGTLHYAVHVSGPAANDFGKPSSLSPSASEAPVPPSPASPPPTSAALPPYLASASLPPPPPTPQSSASLPSSVSPPPPSPVLSSPFPAPSSQAAVATAAAPITSQATAVPDSIPPLPSATTIDDSGGEGKGDVGSLSGRTLDNFRRTAAVDVNVAATINFTGSAFYVFCALPVQISDASILGLTNLAFFLDDRLVGNFTHNPQTDTGSTTGFQYQVLVFSKVDLPYAPHVLVIKPALGSMLLLDYVQYTTLDTVSRNASGSLAPQAAPSVSIVSASTGTSNKNTTTFAVAIGSTLGVLAVLSFTVFISICMRRRKSAKREKLVEAMDAANRPPSPEMRGPRPFIPRYFPGNIRPRPYSPPRFSPLTVTSSRVEESGPSHGLDFPPSPEHLDAPAYSPPPLVLSEVSRIPVSLLAPTTRVPPPMAEMGLPHYQDVGRTPLVSIPMYASSIGSVVVEPSSSSFWRTEGEDTHLSSSLLPEHPDINQEESAAGRINLSTINN